MVAIYSNIYITEWLSNRCRLVNLKYYQADVSWRISNTIKLMSVADSQILSSRRRDVIQATLIFWNNMFCNTLLSYSARWQH